MPLSRENIPKLFLAGALKLISLSWNFRNFTVNVKTSLIRLFFKTLLSHKHLSQAVI